MLAETTKSTQPTFAFSGFTLEQVNLVLNGLRELPHKLVHELVTGITNVAQGQLKDHNDKKAAEAASAYAYENAPKSEAPVDEVTDVVSRPVAVAVDPV